MANRCALLALACALLAAAPTAQQKKGTTRQPARPERKAIEVKPSGYSLDSFDPQAKELPLNYRGHSIEQTFLRLSPPTKGEFETTAQYQARIPRPQEGETFAFLMEANTDSGPFIRYNADAGRFELRVYETWGVFDGFGRSFSSRAFLIKKTLVNESTSLKSNAFGATVEVHERRFVSYAVATSGRTPGPGEERLHRIFVPMVPERAALMKDRFGLLFICGAYTGTDAQTFSGFDSQKATITAPSETSEAHHYLRIGGLIGVWVYDLASGTVLDRLTNF